MYVEKIVNQQVAGVACVVKTIVYGNKQRVKRSYSVETGELIKVKFLRTRRSIPVAIRVHLKFKEDVIAKSIAELL